VPQERLRFIGGLPLESHFDVFREVDISLDTLPYNGVITTLESLWMGVPVVTLAGRSHIFRSGVSLLGTAGFPGWIADSPEEYVKIAVKMASDRPALTRLRGTLRKRMEDSPLTAAGAYTGDLETAYRQMWESLPT